MGACRGRSRESYARFGLAISTSPILLWWKNWFLPLSHSICTPDQSLALTVPRSSALSRQATRWPMLRRLDWAGVIAFTANLQFDRAFQSGNAAQQTHR